MPRRGFNKAMRFVIVWAVASLIVAFAPLQSQQPAPTASPEASAIPPGPLMKSAPSSSQWIVEFKYTDGKVNANHPNQAPSIHEQARVMKITAVRSGPVTYEESVDEMGKRKEKWFSNNNQYIRDPKSSIYSIAGDKEFSSVDREYHSPTGFAGFDWISKGNFLGVQKVLGRDCLIFHDQKEEGAVVDPDLIAHMREVRADFGHKDGKTKPDAAALLIDVTACIDATTRLPVLLQLGGETRTFTFLEPPSSPVALPDDLKNQLEQRQKAWSKMLQAAPRR